MGTLSPNPFAPNRALSIPLLTMYATTALAREFDSSILYRDSPTRIGMCPKFDPNIGILIH